MGPPPRALAVAAQRGQRDRGLAGRRGGPDQGPLPLSTVTLYTAPGCHLCDLARGELEALRVELGFELREVSIDGDPELERAHRVFIPVIEVDGERVSVYRVEEDALRARLASGTPGPASQTGSADGGL